MMSNALVLQMIDTLWVASWGTVGRFILVIEKPC